MITEREIVFTVDLPTRTRPARLAAAETEPAIPRIARLLALAIRLEELIKIGTIRDYAEAARLGRVTRARMTQIMQLLYLAPDIQEQILFQAPAGLKERNLRPIVKLIRWNDQRKLYQKVIRPPA